MRISELQGNDRELAAALFEDITPTIFPEDFPLTFLSQLPRLLIRNKFLAKVSDDAGLTLLHRAALKGNLQVCTQLLEGGADVNARDDKGMTPLHHATMRNSIPIMKEMIRPDTQIDAQDDDGNTSLHHATCQEAVTFLLRHGANPNIQNHQGKLPVEKFSYDAIAAATTDIYNIIHQDIENPSYLTKKRLLNKDKITDLTQNICGAGLFYEKLFRPLLDSKKPKDRQLLDDVFHALPSQWQIRFTHLYTVFAREQTQKLFDPLSLSQTGYVERG